MAMNCFSCPEGTSWELCNRTARPVPCPYVVDPRCVKVSIKRSWTENSTTAGLVIKSNETFMKFGCISHLQCEAEDFDPCIQDNTSHIAVRCSRWCCYGNLCNQATSLNTKSKCFLLTLGLFPFLLTSEVTL